MNDMETVEKKAEEVAAEETKAEETKDQVSDEIQDITEESITSMSDEDLEKILNKDTSDPNDTSKAPESQEKQAEQKEKKAPESQEKQAEQKEKKAPESEKEKKPKPRAPVQPNALQTRKNQLLTEYKKLDSIDLNEIAITDPNQFKAIMLRMGQIERNFETIEHQERAMYQDVQQERNRRTVESIIPEGIDMEGMLAVAEKYQTPEQMKALKENPYQFEPSAILFYNEVGKRNKETEALKKQIEELKKASGEIITDIKKAAKTPGLDNSNSGAVESFVVPKNDTSEWTDEQLKNYLKKFEKT